MIEIDAHEPIGGFMVQRRFHATADRVHAAFVERAKRHLPTRRQPASAWKTCSTCSSQQSAEAPTRTPAHARTTAPEPHPTDTETRQ